MSYHKDLIEAQLATSLHNELLRMEKEASIWTAALKGGAKVAPWAARQAGRVGSFVKSIPGRLAYRTTGYVRGGKGLTQAQRAEKLKAMGVRGTEGVTGAKKELVEMAGKAKGKEGILAGRKADKIRELEKAHGSLEKAPPEALAKALGGQGQEVLARGQAYEMGMTSLPGYVRAMAKQPGKALRVGWHEQGRLGKAMTTGFGGWGAYNVATAPEGERLKVLSEELPAAALYAVTGPLGMTGQLLAADLPTAAVSKAVGKLTKAKPSAAAMPTPEIIRRAATTGPVGKVIPKPVAETAAQTAERVGSLVPPGMGSQRMQTLQRAAGTALRDVPAPAPAPVGRVAPRPRVV